VGGPPRPAAGAVDRIRAQGKDGKVLDVLTKVQNMSSVDNSDNLYVIAPTGSGKTIAFMAPIPQAMHDGRWTAPFC
jgi:CRISPR/Cas system-associated endonuclease/helicase Cas3